MSHATTTDAAIGTVDRAVQPYRLRAVDYLRVSTEEQKAGYGTASQARRNKGYFAARGMEHVGTYCDDGVSGSLEMGERPDFDRLMRDAHTIGPDGRRPFDIVGVSKGDRIGRNGRAFWRWVWALEDLGIFVAVTSKGYDNSTRAGRSQMRKDADYAEEEWETIRERTTDGAQTKAETALDGGVPHIGGPPPFGYRIVGKGKGSTLAVDDAISEFVDEVYGLRVGRRMSWDQAAVEVNANGHRTTGGLLWTGANLSARIMSPAILDGVMLFRGKQAKRDPETGRPIHGDEVTIRLPRILTEEQAEKLRTVADERGHRMSGRRAVYPLSLRMRAVCGNHYTGIDQSSIGAGRSYRCSGKKPKFPGGPRCGCPQIDAPAMEALVWSQIVSLLGEPDRLEALAAEWVGMSQGDPKAHAERIAELDKQIGIQRHTLTAVITATARSAASAGMDDAESAALVAEASAPVEVELQQLRRMRSEAVAWLAEMDDQEQRAQDLQELARTARYSLGNVGPAEQDLLLGLLECRITVTGPTPRRPRRGAGCSVRSWFEGAGRGVPAGPMTDAQWRRVAEVLASRCLPERHPGLHRGVVDLLCRKAREGLSWRQLEAQAHGRSAQSIFLRWAETGVWALVDGALGECERVPVAGPPLPPISIEGHFDPRVILSAGERAPRGW